MTAVWIGFRKDGEINPRRTKPFLSLHSLRPLRPCVKTPVSGAAGEEIAAAS